MSGPAGGTVGAEVIRAIFGAYRLAHFDATGLAYFNNTVEGFWRSFIAAALAAPAMAILIRIDWGLAAQAGQPLTNGLGHAVLVEILAYVIGWTALPLAMHAICEYAGWRDRYIGYIVALNWVSLFEIAILLPVSAASVSGLLPDGLAVLVQIVVYGYFIGLEIFVARRALAIGIPPAIAVVIFGIVLAVSIHQIANGFL